MAGRQSFWSLVKPDQTVVVCVTDADSDLIVLSLVSDVTVVFKNSEGMFEILFRRTPSVFDCRTIYFLGEVGFRFKPDGRSLEPVAEPGRVFTAADAMKIFDEIFAHYSLPAPASQPSVYALLRQGGYPN